MNFDALFGEGGSRRSSSELITPAIAPTSRESTVAEKVGGYWHSFSRQTRGLFTEVPPTEEALLELPQEQGYRDSIGEMLDLTYSQRLSAFFLSLGIGVFFSLLAISTGPAIILVTPKKFAFFLTVGNLFCLFSTTFLVGLSYQLSSMFSANRFQAALLYVGAVLLTFYFAVVRPLGIACLLMAVVQVGCLLWYCLSFVPFARRFVRVASSSSWAAMLMLRQAFRSVISAFS